MGMMNEHAIAVLPTPPERLRNRDVFYPYRPGSDFYYLTGFDEPEAVAVLAPGRSQGEYVLFCRESDAEKEAWDGPRAGLQGACERYGADDAFPIDDLDDILPGMLENRERLFYNIGEDRDFDGRVMRWVGQLRERARAGVTAPVEFISLTHLLHEMRMFKSRHEVRTMRRAAKIAAEAHVRAMRACRPGLMEYHLEAEILHEFLRHGRGVPAYPPIIGCGANGCVLHYTANCAPLQDGELVLIDAGVEHNYYASDVSRTFPVNGRFSAEQRAVYEVVLDAQRAAIAEALVGRHWNDPHLAALRVLTDGLVTLGILQGEVDGLIEQRAYFPYYMHRTGHWLGMDVHDVGDYRVEGQWRTLEAGMALTVEPGLYLRAGTRNLEERWWNIGVRIEDDVLVGRNGPEVLSADAPKAVDELQALMAH